MVMHVHDTKVLQWRIWFCSHNVRKHLQESFSLMTAPDISVLMLVFNSAVECPTVLTMFQDHTWRHYHYLQDSLPDLVPKLKVGH